MRLSDPANANFENKDFLIVISCGKFLRYRLILLLSLIKGSTQISIITICQITKKGVNSFMTEAVIIQKPVKSVDWVLYDNGFRHEKVK